MRKNIIIIAVLAAFNYSLRAVPAKSGLLVFTQPDGTIVELRKLGDERSHITLSPEGYPVTLSSDGFYYFAKIGQKGELIPTDVKVSPVETLTESEKNTVEAIDRSKIDRLMEERYEASPMVLSQNMAMSRAGGIGLVDNAFLGREELKGLVILAQYQDVRFSETCSRDFFDVMLNESGFSQYDATGSARDYFIDASKGKFTPEFDVYGPVTLPHNMAYYGGNSPYDDSDKNAAQMIYDACKGLDGEINFADYDLDGDGYVDNVFVFYAGYGEASYGSDDSVWPHQWNLSSAGLSLRLDGVRINKYACSNELVKDKRGNPKPDGIGTFVHEFSHVLGLPDLYVTSNATGNWTPLDWSILDQGPYNNDSRTPPTYSVYERYALGWIDPIVINGAHSITLNPILESNEACIIPTSSENEFFLLENRQKTGWDSYIPGHGMLIWHIDYDPNVWRRNTVNNTESHNRVDIEEAYGQWANPNKFSSNKAYRQAVADYAFPGSTGVTSFTDNTTPSMRTWGGNGLGLPITDIEEKGGVITFNVAGGHCDAEIPVVTEPVSYGTDWFEATWLPAEGAVDYLLTVKGDFGSGRTPDGDVADFAADNDGKATLPEGWSFISNDGEIYDNYFGESAPSLKLMTKGAGVLTREYDSDILSLEFWLMGIFTNAQSTLDVECNVGGEWITIRSIVPSRNNGELITVDAFPAGTRQLRLIFNRGTLGNLALDDVKVIFKGGGITTLPGYNMRSVGNVTSHRIENLPEGVTSYIYSVCAVDHNGRRSAWSDEQALDLSSNNAGIDDVVVDDTNAPVRYYNLQGVEIDRPSSGIVIRRQGDKVEKIVY